MILQGSNLHDMNAKLAFSTRIFSLASMNHTPLFTPQTLQDLTDSKRAPSETHPSSYLPFSLSLHPKKEKLRKICGKIIGVEEQVDKERGTTA